MKQTQEWFIEKLKEASGFSVWVEIADDTMSGVSIDKATAITLVQTGAEYGYYADGMLIIGAIPQDRENKQRLQLKEDPVVPREKMPSQEVEVVEVASTYSEITANIKQKLSMGYTLVMHYPAMDLQVLVFSKPK